MDDSFSFRSTLPIGPRIDRRIVRASVAGAIVVVAIGSFARWVIASERESFSRARGRSIVADVAVGQIPGIALPTGTDEDARESLDVALAAARAATAEGGSFLAAGPSRLAELQPGYTFVDGPSTTHRIVSVSVEPDAWAAAVLSPSGTCFWIRVGVDDRAVTGTADVCTGADALTLAASGR